jgi:SAM-dependent methyltransferase
MPMADESLCAEDDFASVPSWEEVRPYLRYTLEGMDHGTLLDDVLFDRVSDDLCKIYAYTTPDGLYLTWIDHFTVEGWGVNREEIVQQAELNMRGIAALAILHQDLPREGPGSDECTREALSRLPPLPPNGVVVDLGCGPGRQTLVLAKTLNTRVIAVDIHRPYLEQLSRSVTAEGLSQLIETRCADIGALDFGPGSIDLIWSEGAAYILGFEESLRRWRSLLKPGGLMSVTECTWLDDCPPEEAESFWKSGYPSMGTIDQNCRRAQDAGLTVIDTFPLPASAWWNDYYTPLLARVAQLRPTADAGLLALLDETVREIELFHKYSDSYGYVFYLMRT